MDIEDNPQMKSPNKLNFLRKSLSSIGLNVCSPNLTVREAKSLTGTTGESRINPVKNTDHGGRNYHEEIFTDAKSYQSDIDEKGYETREVISNQIFLVKDEMLTYRGTRYSPSDIAIKWKKDCRMWLWKSNKHNSVGELRDKLQNLKLHN